jgi:hypothetical protein
MSEDTERRLANLERVIGEVFDANAKYYATRDTAKAEALESLIIKLFREVLGALRESD